MDYPFRMYGETVEIYRYKVDYTMQIDPESDPVGSVWYASTQEEAQAIAAKLGGTVTALDSSSYEWIDGLTFATRNDAMAAYDLGADGYAAKVQEEQAMSINAQITDLQLALAELYEAMI